jgi:hypothetical protein
MPIDRNLDGESRDRIVHGVNLAVSWCFLCKATGRSAKASSACVHPAQNRNVEHGRCFLGASPQATKLQKVRSMAGGPNSSS